MASEKPMTGSMAMDRGMRERRHTRAGWQLEDDGREAVTTIVSE